MNNNKILHHKNDIFMLNFVKNINGILKKKKKKKLNLRKINLKLNTSV